MYKSRGWILALICFLAAAAPANPGNAQSDKAWKMVGLWVHSRSQQCRFTYQLTAVSGGEVKLRLRSSSGGCTTGIDEFRLTLSGNDLKGTALTGRGMGGNFCNFSPKTFPTTGRILDNGRTMVVTVRQLDFGVRPCKWLSRTEEYSYRLTRQ